MKIKKLALWMTVWLFVAVLAACRAPGTPTPIAIPTPNLTLTALFEPTETIPPSVTPPAIQTATPMDSAEASPTPVPTQTDAPAGAEPTAAPTKAPGDAPTETQTPVVAPDERPGATVEAAYLSSPPAIDGNLGDWDLVDQPLVSIVYDPGFIHAGPDDLSGSFMVGWDDNQLYIAAEVKDDQHVQVATGRRLYLGDSLEILLDKDLTGDYYSTALTSDDYQIGISPGSPIGESPEAYLWFPEANEGPRITINIAATATETGYVIEMAIPWSVFGLTPEEGDTFGFGFSLSDNDELGTELQQVMVSNLSNRLLINPTTWGNLVLVQP